MQTNTTTNFPEEIPARALAIPLGRRRFLTTLGAITSVFALGMEPLMADPGDPAWDAALREPAAAHLARPSANQYAWHEQERTMFVCIGVPTWEGTEYDADGRTDLSKIDPAEFDADAIALAAKSWGARQLLLVCTHVGGFALWPTETTDYHIGRTPWRNGEGDMVREVAEACRRHGLKMGVYLYPDDTRFARGIGRSGRTDDPARQEEWNRLYIRQWEEVLTLCGPDLINEVWLDGGCIIDIEPTIRRLAPKAVFFGWTKHEPIRWVGNERGIAPDVNWNAIRREDLVANHGHRASDPDGDSWAPVETNTTLYDHYWFWTPANETRRKSVDHLMHLFVKSVGNGSIFLLNSTPNTTGLLPEDDVKRYAEFGEAIERNFGRPLGRTEAPVVGVEAECAPDGPVTINCADVWEDYRLGHRIREFVVEGWTGGGWVKLAEGEAVGRRKLVFFPPTTVDRVRVRVTRSVGTPVIRLLQVHQVDPALAGALIPPLSRQAPATASSIHSAPYAVEMLVDGDTSTRWGAADGDPDPWVELDLGRPRKIARATLSELADRVRAFRIEYRNTPDGEWRIAHEGTTIGETWASDFDRVTARFVRLQIQEYTGPAPTLWSWELFDRADAFETVGTWQAGAEGAWDLSTAINEAGRYEIQFIDDDGAPMRVVSAQLFFEGEAAAADNFSGVGETSLRLSRSQAIGPGASSRLQARIDAPAGRTGKVLLRPAP
jgi:alpha-L-fucosidase